MAVLTRLREVAVDRGRNKSDRILFGTMLALSAFGLLMVYSATRSSGSVGMERQMIFVAAGLTLYAVISNIDYRELKNLIPIMSIAVLVGLFAVYLFEPVNGARRWIDLGFFKLQPAEFAKVIVILLLAAILSPSNREEVGQRQLTWPTVFRAIFIVALPAVLVLFEPDLGTTLVFGFILFVMLFVAGATWRQMLALAGTAALGVVAVLQFKLLEEYQMNRILVLFRPEIDPQGIGYNILQSRYAVGSGQLFGKGLFAEGTQTSFEYVPEQETDFIFTAVAEQLGFVGGVLVVAAFAVIIWRLLVIAANARDRFGALIASGLAAMMVFHVFVNVGMTIGIMPVTGIPLPFLSAGGSFYLAMTLALGIANSVWLLRTPVPGENQLS
ncbi:MAG TPA: rod shape-determining protein RodA [Acidimicrobiia bacterium]|nr:rodA [Acidimicrobiia bacterium]HYJ25948.1 rod shape-determining protein RodA [Acidimicrobiia bacterium]